jgi:hypothetical protein
MNRDDDIAVVRTLKAGEPCRVRLWPVQQLHPGRPGGPVRYHNRFHLIFL